MAAARSDDQQASAAESAHAAPPAPVTLRQRNRTLALMLACVVGAMFVTVFTLVVLFHYAEAHHMLVQL